jgi:hypothetical protein
MNQQARTSGPSPAPRSLSRPIASGAEAQQVLADVSDAMGALLGVVEEETELVRAGRLTAAAKLEARKAELARRYITGSERVKANQPYLTKTLPEAVRALRDRHQQFQSLLQVNLQVLATAHAVSEGIMRGVAEEVARRAAPQTYGASGRQVAPNPRHAQPLTVSRTS